MNLEAVLRIAAKVVGLEDVTKLERGIAGAEKAAQSASAGFKAVANSQMWQAAAVAAAGVGVAIGLSVRAAVDFERSLSDVRKVVDGLESPAALAQIKSEIIDLSSRMPIAAKGFAEIYAAAGAAGVAKSDLKGFAEMVATVATAFDMTAAEAGKSLAQMQVALGLPLDGLRQLADQINYLENSVANVSASALVDFVARAGAMGKIAGLAAEETAGFGAAMISMGFETEVAATSFNNMIRALSKGPSMTDRQVGALQRLGYAVVDAATEEKRLSDSVQRESDRRLGIYRQETDGLLKEIGRRYRNQLRQLQDGWDDESRAQEDALRDRADAQIRAINKNDALTEDAKRQYIDSIQDQVDQEIRLIQRSARDRQQAIRDQLDDREDAERNAVESRFKAVEAAEKTYVEDAKANAKARGKELSDAWKQGFADRLQNDAAGTIREILGRIAELPKAQQVSVISDLFGDEARALPALINNIGALDDALSKATDKQKAAGSVLRDYAARMETAAAQSQVAKNNLENLAIVMGDSFLPILTAVAKTLQPIIGSFTWLVQNVPILGPIIGGLGSAFVALVAAAPFISAFITLLSQLAPLAAAIGVAWAGLQTVFIVAFQGILAWMGSTLLPALLAFFSGPIGWTVLAIAAVVAMAIAFREPLMNFLTWLWEWGEPIRKFWIGLWDGLVAFVGFSLGTISKVLSTYAGVLLKLWSGMFSALQKVVDVWRGAVQAVWSVVGRAFTTFVVEPIRNAWTGLTSWLRNAINSVVQIAQGAWTVMADSLRNVFRGVLQFIANQINAVAGLINRLIAGYNSLPNFGDLPFIPTVAVPAFAEGGVVNRPTVGLVGEAGREYIIPESKMAAASSRFLAGQRGASVIPAGSSSPTTAARTPQVNITTGPVMQQQDGSRWVSIDDLERATQQTAEQVLAMLRTPQARIALGR
jgi:TP901 family phage tail tape measure protein